MTLRVPNLVANQTLPRSRFAPDVLNELAYLHHTECGKDANVHEDPHAESHWCLEPNRGMCAIIGPEKVSNSGIEVSTWTHIKISREHFNVSHLCTFPIKHHQTIRLSMKQCLKQTNRDILSIPIHTKLKAEKKRNKHTNTHHISYIIHCIHTVYIYVYIYKPLYVYYHGPINDHTC